MTTAPVSQSTRNEFDLTGHVSIVTGGNSGIGVGIARSLLDAGASVAILGRREERNDATLEQLGCGSRAAAWQCDVADEGRVDAVFGEVAERFGRLDSCFVNAAGPGVDKPFVDLTHDDWRSTLAVNLDGAFFTARAAARTMADQDGPGSIVFTSSLAAISGRAQGQAYAAAKGGIDAMMLAMATELPRHGIRANSILPGWFETPMSTDFVASSPAEDRILKRIPVRRWGVPEDLGPLCVFLAGPTSSYLNGQTITVDGGYSVF